MPWGRRFVQERMPGLPGGVWLGMVTGKTVADVVWYGAEASVRRGLARSRAA